MGNKSEFADHLRTTPRRRGYRYDEARIERERAEREARWVAEMDAMDRRFGLCYFIGNVEAAIVKIGHSRNVAGRLTKLRSSSPWPLTLLASATGADERELYYHRKFAASAIGGEWFELTPEIAAEIDRLNGAGTKNRPVKDQWGGLSVSNWSAPIWPLPSEGQARTDLSHCCHSVPANNDGTNRCKTVVAHIVAHTGCLPHGGG